MAGVLSRPSAYLLLMIIMSLSLSSTRPQSSSKEDQFGGKQNKPWWMKLIQPLEKPFRTIQSAHTLLLGGGKDRARGYSGNDIPSGGKDRTVPNKPTPTTRIPHTTRLQPVVVTVPTTKLTTTTTPTTTTTISTTTTPAVPFPDPREPLEDSPKVRMNLQRFLEEPCGMSLETKILFGEQTMPGEFPWLGLLRVRDVYFGGLRYICGGTLINNRYVITAAHCVKDFRYKLVSVRLGEFNTESEEKPCTDLDMALMTNYEQEICRADPPKDYPVDDIIVHPRYKPNNGLPNDIALVRIQDILEFTRYVTPVCLPVGDLSIDLTSGINATVAGWGMTEKLNTSNIPLKANLPLMEFSACKRLVRDVIPGKLCVGDNKGSSTCRGDSGGPLIHRTMMMPIEESNDLEQSIYSGYTRSVLLGIVSAGPKSCSDIQPTLTTNVLDYINWIMHNIDP